MASMLSYDKNHLTLLRNNMHPFFYIADERSTFLFIENEVKHYNIVETRIY